jgi:hypothetical protein
MCNISKELLPQTAKGCEAQSFQSTRCMMNALYISIIMNIKKNCRNVNCNSKYCIPLFSRFKGEKKYIFPFHKNSAMNWMRFIQRYIFFVPLFLLLPLFLFIKINILHHYLLMLIKSNVLCWKWKIYNK